MKNLSLVECKNSLKQKLTQASVAAATFLSAKGMYYASETGTSLEISSNMSTTATNFVNEIAVIYTKSLFPLVVLIALGFMFFSKDDKIVTWAKRIGFGALVVYIICKIFLANTSDNTITRSLDTITNWVSGGN